MEYEDLPNTIKLKYFNAQFIVNKLPEFHNLLSDEIYDLIAISESWCNGSDKHPDSLIVGGSSYIVVRSDRIGTQGGGVLLLVKPPLKVNIISVMANEIECLWADVLCSRDRFRVGVVYRPPGQNGSSFDCVFTTLNRFALSAYPVYIIEELRIKSS